MSKKKKSSPWSYVVDLDGKIVGSFPSSALAFFVWRSYVDWSFRKYPDSDDRPFVSCNRYRAKYDPFGVEGQDLTMIFIKHFEVINSKTVKDET